MTFDLTTSNLEKRGWKVKKLMYNRSEFDCKGEQIFNFSEKSPSIFRKRFRTKVSARIVTFVNGRSQNVQTTCQIGRNCQNYSSNLTEIGQISGGNALFRWSTCHISPNFLRLLHAMQHKRRSFSSFQRGPYQIGLLTPAKFLEKLTDLLDVVKSKGIIRR